MFNLLELYFLSVEGVGDAEGLSSGATVLGEDIHSLLLAVGSRVGALLAQGAVQLVAVVGVDTVLVAPPVVLQLDLRWRWRSLGRDRCTL